MREKLPFPRRRLVLHSGGRITNGFTAVTHNSAIKKSRNRLKLELRNVDHTFLIWQHFSRKSEIPNFFDTIEFTVITKTYTYLLLMDVEVEPQNNSVQKAYSQFFLN